MLPSNLVFFVTIPDVRMGGCFVRLFPLSFFLCITWIGAISYVVTWMITIIGFTLKVPDSVMGLTFLAVGTSIPEVLSSLIVSREGRGGMAVSNSIGSNTFDILLCLGLPWLIKSLARTDDVNFVNVQSEGLTYTVITLLLSLIILYVLLVVNRFVLSKGLGAACTIIYAVFLSVSILFEMNVIIKGVNLPMCASNY